MTTRSVPRFAFALCLALALVSCREGDDQTPADLRRRIDALQTVVERLRGETFRHPVQGRYVPRDRLLEVYDSAAWEHGDPADSAWMPLLWAFGFIDSIDQDPGVADSVDRASIGAFYAKGTLWVVEDVRDSSDELDVTVVHELVHALQDQRWDLGAMTSRAQGIDSRLALQYLIEGEARLVETMFLEEHRDSLLARLSPMPLDAYRDTLRAGDGLDPELVTIPVFHPYDQGAHVLSRRWATGGWEAVDRWWRSPPASTACFLEPGAPCFLPTPLPLAPLAEFPSPWKRIHRGRLGALYTNILFSIWSGSDAWLAPEDLRSGHLLREGLDLPPDQVTRGLVSDSFALWEGDSGALALAWRTRWRDDSAASRFLESWTRLLVRKQREDAIVARQPGILTLARDVQAGVWDRVERFGSEVWILEGMPGPSVAVFEGGQRRRSGATRSLGATLRSRSSLR